MPTRELYISRFFYDNNDNDKTKMLANLSWQQVVKPDRTATAAWKLFNRALLSCSDKIIVPGQGLRHECVSWFAVRSLLLSPSTTTNNDISIPQYQLSYLAATCDTMLTAWTLLRGRAEFTIISLDRKSGQGANQDKALEKEQRDNCRQNDKLGLIPGKPFLWAWTRTVSYLCATSFPQTLATTSHDNAADDEDDEHRREDMAVWNISTLKRRRKKMNKHKHRKRMKRLRRQTRKY